MGFKNLFRHIRVRKEGKFISDGDICRVETAEVEGKRVKIYWTESPPEGVKAVTYKDKLRILIYDMVDPLLSSAALEHEIERIRAFLSGEIFKGPVETKKMKECSGAFEIYYQDRFVRGMIDILMREKPLIDKILSAYSFIETGGSEA